MDETSLLTHFGHRGLVPTVTDATPPEPFSDDHSSYHPRELGGNESGHARRRYACKCIRE
jgi:hypothetical protein